MTLKLDCAAVLLLLASADLLIPYASGAGKSEGVCISPGGRFPRFLNEGKPPRKVDKGPNDLTLCRVFRKKTCCDVTQTHPALLSIRRLASTGEASEECLQLWELLECSVCDPKVGVQRGPPAICASLCDRVYEACSKAYFSMDAKSQVLAPCGVNEFVCGKASEWISNGTELCQVAGFSVKPSDGIECYGGKPSLDSIADTWSATKFRVPQPSTKSRAPQKAKKSGFVKYFQKRLKRMSSNERVSWTVGGMVLTAGLLFASRRKSQSHRQKQAAIQRAARLKLGNRN